MPGSLSARPASLPLLLLDVDGVLNPYAAPWLAELAARFRIVWATAWQAEANRLLAPLLALPELPVIRFPVVADQPIDKLPAVIGFAGDEPKRALAR